MSESSKPKLEVYAKAERRRFTAGYKWRIVSEAGQLLVISFFPQIC